MDVETIPPMKPVLVEHVSDNINVLQKDDVTKQKTVLTARAIEDVFKCAPIDSSNAADTKFFNTNGKVDLNRIVEACSRTLARDQYVNGPTIYALSTDDDKLRTDRQHGNQWAVNNIPVTATWGGFLYVYSILDDGEMTWNNYDQVISIDDRLDRKVDGRRISAKIRQVFVPNRFNDYLFEDGTKSRETPAQSYLKDHRSRYNLGVPWTRTAYPHFTRTVDETVKNDTATGELKIYCTKEGDSYRPIPGIKLGDAISGIVYEFKEWVWEDWYMMSKEHNGPEYFTNIRIDTPCSISTPLADAVYHIYNEVAEFVLPNANLDAYKVGQKIIVEVHPPVNADLSSCRVFYQDTTSRGETDLGETQSILITPRTRRNTKDVYGNVAEDVLLTSVACFEVVEIKEGEDTFRTWELDAGVEETDFTSGLAQMLGEHTDRCTGDLVQYQRDLMSGEKTISIAYPLTAAGFVIARFLKKDPTGALNDSNWRANIKIVHGNSDACFVKVTDYTVSPDPGLIYYIKENGMSFSLANGDGHPTNWDGTHEYYSLDMTHASSIDVIMVRHGTSTTTDNNLYLSDLEFDKMRGFSAYGNRGDVLCIEITTGSNKYISQFQGKVFPVVAFCPDPHDSYIHKASINPSAFTYNQLTKLFLDGTTVDDIRLANATELLEGLMNSPVSTRALIEAYTYLATKLQAKGLLFGNCQKFSYTAAEMNALVDGGFYFVKPKTLSTTAGVFPPNMTTNGCNIVVVSNKTCPGTTVHEEENTVVAQDKAVQIAITTGDPTDPSGDMFAIYTRIGFKNTSTNVWTWSAWRPLNDWRNLDNKPKYFHARWDYLNDPNDFLNHLNVIDNTSGSYSGIGNNCGVHSISAATISALMNTVTEVNDDLEETANTRTHEGTARSIDYEYSEPVSKQVPQFLVGLSKYDASLSGKDYVVDITLPTAPASQLTSTTKTKRRKIRFLFAGSENILNAGVKSIWIYVHYSDGSKTYTYKRNWGSDFTSADHGITAGIVSMLDIEFEQADMPTENGSKRLWCPIEIG